MSEQTERMEMSAIHKTDGAVSGATPVSQPGCSTCGGPGGNLGVRLGSPG